MDNLGSASRTNHHIRDASDFRHASPNRVPEQDPNDVHLGNRDLVDADVGADAVPVSEDAVRVSEDVAPASVDAAAALEDVVPVSVDVVPALADVVPVSEDVVPALEDVVLV